VTPTESRLREALRKLLDGLPTFEKSEGLEHLGVRGESIRLTVGDVLRAREALSLPQPAPGRLEALERVAEVARYYIQSMGDRKTLRQAVVALDATEAQPAASGEPTEDYDIGFVSGLEAAAKWYEEQGVDPFSSGYEARLHSESASSIRSLLPGKEESPR
jgi:hypothetical protein